MAKINKVRGKYTSGHRRAIPYSLKSCPEKDVKDAHVKNCSKASENKEWEDVTCSVCLDVPHNAVLLLCSSYNKGCRPYMCATSHRYSNCLDQYKNAYTKVASTPSSQSALDNSTFAFGAGELKGNLEVQELLCPLCRGQVKGWTVVEPARNYLNAKKRNCMQDYCSFVGTYKELRKHVKAKHPCARPRAVDPILDEKWKRLEHERDRNDVISTILATTPGALVLGDYVLEPSYQDLYSDSDSDEDYEEDDFFSTLSFDVGRNSRVFSRISYAGYDYETDPDSDILATSEFPIRRAPRVPTAASARGLQRLGFGRSRTWHRQRRPF